MFHTTNLSVQNTNTPDQIRFEFTNIDYNINNTNELCTPDSFTNQNIPDPKIEKTHNTRYESHPIIP